MYHKLMKSQSQPRFKIITTHSIKSDLETFLTNKGHLYPNQHSIITSSINRNGFFEILNGGFKNNGAQTIEVILPVEVDLSIKQNQGFSLYFWLLSNKPLVPRDKNFPFYIIKKGSTVDQFTPTIGLVSNGTFVFVKVSTTKSSRELVFSKRKIEYGRLYSVAVTFEIDHDDESTVVSIYFDGKLDSQKTIVGEPIHNQGNIFLGKPDDTSHSFKGSIADIILIPRILYENEVKTIFNSSMNNLSMNNGTSMNTIGIFKELFERYKLIEKYSLFTKKPIYAVENLNLSNKRMLEVVKNYDVEEQKCTLPPIRNDMNPQEETMIHHMSIFLKNEDNDTLARKIMENGCVINTVFFLMNKGEENLEMERILAIFQVLSETLHFIVRGPFLINLAKHLNAIVIEKKEGKGAKKITNYFLTIRKFFKNLQYSLQKLESLQQEEDEKNAQFHSRKNKLLTIKTFYNNRPGKLIRNESFISGRRNLFGFTLSVAEHEKLLHKGQGFKNIIDDPTQNSLENFKSTFVLKSIYEKPKNLPGENPECPNAKIIETSVPVTRNNEKDEEESDEDEPSEETIKLSKDYVKKVFELASYRAQINENIIKNDEMADNAQKIILERKIQIAKEIEESEQQRKELEKKKQDTIIKQTMSTEPVVEEEKNLYDPSIPDNWTDGNFEVVINHCFNCHKHETTTKHYEYYFINKFNEIGEAISTVFPNCVILGNLDQPEYLGNFDVYLRGTGLPGDEKGRYFIYRKLDTLRFPTTFEIIDKLIALSIMYGNTMNIESAQFDIIKNTVKLSITHDHPATLSEGGEKRKVALLTKIEKEKIDPEYTKLYCVHWGCNQLYVENENKGKSCTYHPGVWQFGSYNGYWPACWTCCEGNWQSSGCKIGHHEGVVSDKKLNLCLNTGEVNQRTGKPDSVCGMYYYDKSDDGCVYHSGYVKGGLWTCCNEDREKKGCVTGKHATEKYPNDKAQLHFYPKAITNPGLLYSKEADQKKKANVADLIANCDYFKDAKIYPNIKEIMKHKKAKEQEEESLKRICFNWGCEKEYTDLENHDKACTCHPGKWDHGSTGSTMVKFIAELNSSNVKNKSILWQPHWSCCHRNWNDKGCKLTRHHGPTELDLPRYNKKYKYPDERLKLSFNKIVGERWKEYLNQFIYDEQKVRKICKKFFMGGKMHISEIPKLCDDLKLYLILVQENPEWTMKFYDVVNQNGSVPFFAVDGMVEMEKFIQWWHTDYETIYEKVLSMKKK